jgi:glycosyltransferase involved in cell wall biosynthesis
MLSAFSIVKNEAQFIGYGVMSLLPYVDEIVYADGGSTDGTLELLRHIGLKYAPGKLRVFEGMDCANLKEDYVRLFNDVMEKCTGDYLWYCHPDMILTNPGSLQNIGLDPSKWAWSVRMRSFAGENLDREITRGRRTHWKTIMKRDFDLRYWGFYGDENEDMYFEAITGDEHLVHPNFKAYPYEVHDSQATLWHFCECKPKVRREEKMEKVFKTNYPSIDSVEALKTHPRITLDEREKKWGDFAFTPRVDALPDVFAKYKEEFDAVLSR